MKSLKSLKRYHSDIEHFETKKGIKLRNRFVATRKENDIPWYMDKASRVPSALVDELALKSMSFSRSSLGTSKEEVALNQLISCTVIGIIESGLYFSDDADDKSYFEDILVCRPNRGVFSSVDIYVRQSKAGAFQSNDIRRMVGQVVPVKVVNLKMVRQEVRVKQIRDETNTRNLDEYVAIGDIDIAEYLINAPLAKEIINNIKDDDKSGTIWDRQKGRIVNISDNGVFVFTPKMERVFIPNNALTHFYKSPLFNEMFPFKIGEDIDFLFENAQIISATPEQNIKGIVGQVPIIRGTRLELEKNPGDVIKQVILSGKGTVVTGYVTNFDNVRGHLFEIDGAPGFPILLSPNKTFSYDDFKNRKKITATLLSGSFTEGDYLKVKAKASILGGFIDAHADDNFFDF